jgi:hypothetical protein
MNNHLRERLRITPDALDALNAILLDPDMRVVDDVLAVVDRYGTPEEINAKAAAARDLDALRARVAAVKPEFLDDLAWLEEQRDSGAFITVDEYRQQVLGPGAADRSFADDFAVTLEVSAAQYFPWLRVAAERAIEERSLVPGRFIACAR